MKILAIETSCDETAISVVEVENGEEDIDSSNFSPTFKLLGSAINSQIKIHEKYGGVFPMLAKREHAKNIVPVLKLALEKAGMLIEKSSPKNSSVFSHGYFLARKFLELTPSRSLGSKTKEFLKQYKKPNIDLITVTVGPGLEPALWVGINFAVELGKAWNTEVQPANHMEGHIYSVLLQKDKEENNIEFPALALLISGGHTELVLLNNWKERQKIGETRDDAVGEAFDKVARMLGLPYPGGPEISRLAEIARKENLQLETKLPRPMIHSGDYDFSFSGLKTAVLYFLRDSSEVSISQEQKQKIAREFEDAVTEVLISKTEKAIEKHNPKNLIIGGGVIANTHIRNEFKNLQKKIPELNILIPELSLTTDNATMIAIAGFLEYKSNSMKGVALVADGNLSL